MHPANYRKKGQIGEEIASHYLERIGYKILVHNYRFEKGEIDLIAEDGGELVFVEVKARASRAFGMPEDSVTEEKQERIHNAAEGYLYEHNIDNYPVRFDVVAIEFRNGLPEIRHIRDAF
jgi:putative endonuclease